MNILEEIKKWFLTNPLISEKGTIYANLVSNVAVNYSINELPVMNGGIISTSVAGDTINRFDIEFETTVNSTTGNEPLNWDNSKSYQDLMNWINKKNSDREYPNIPNMQEIRIGRTPYVKSQAPNGQTSVYSIQVSFIYKKEKEWWNI